MTVVEEIPGSWDDAAFLELSDIFSRPAITFDGDQVKKMRTLLDYMIAEKDTSFNSEMRTYWSQLGSYTRDAAKKLGIFDYSINLDGQIDVQYGSSVIKEILVKKQKDYGHDNIARFGRIGLLVRVHDKIARLENLIRRGTNPENESIQDNFRDVIGYCAIGMMVEDDIFLLPLRDDIKISAAG
jgi:hypothetical protein